MLRYIICKLCKDITKITDSNRHYCQCGQSYGLLSEETQDIVILGEAILLSEILHGDIDAFIDEANDKEYLKHFSPTLELVMIEKE